LGQFLAPIGLSFVVARWGLAGVFGVAAAIALGLGGAIVWAVEFLEILAENRR
jgi:hypothetical protein